MVKIIEVVGVMHMLDITVSFFVIGDYVNSNTSNTLTPQLGITYSAPTSSLTIADTRYVLMQYSYGSTSNERIKTNIKTIENVVIKRCLLL